MNEDNPKRCILCGQFLTASPEYVGQRCICEGSPLMAAYLAECNGCHQDCFKCESIKTEAGEIQLLGSKPL
jgi:hypothetical protein